VLSSENVRQVFGIGGHAEKRPDGAMDFMLFE